MPKYLISFPSPAMNVPPDELPTVARNAHAVITEAKAAGVYIFAGGIDESIPPILVSPEGTTTPGGHPSSPNLDGGFTILELPTREDAIAWSARIARACRCPQELRAFGLDPQA